jgi:hypothetical protein
MTTRDRGVVVVVLVAAALAGFWFLLLAPKRAEVRALTGKVAAERQSVTDARTRIAVGEAARRSYARNYATVARLGQAVPADDSLPSLIYQLDAAAQSSRIDFRSAKLKPGTGPSSVSSPAAPTSPSTPAQAATATLPPGASVGPAGFPTMPFDLTFDGSFFHMADFFGRLEGFVGAHGRHVRVGGRLLTVDGFALTASRNGFPRVKASVTATAYLVSPTEGATGGASPSASGTNQATSSPGSTGAHPPAAETAMPEPR